MIQRIEAYAQEWKQLSPAWKTIFAESLELKEELQEQHMLELSSIKELDCSNADVKSLEPLRHIPSLERLYLGDTHVNNLWAIQSLKNLKELHAPFGPIKSLTILEGMDQLEILDISYPFKPYRNISPLSDLVNIRELYCNACGITSMHHFVALPHLEVLCLHFNPIPEEEVAAFEELMPQCKVLF
jgi:Leucine-rich repeat (LRR) protein